MVLRLEKEAMAWAIHWLQPVGFVFANLALRLPGGPSTTHFIHIIFVILPMTRNFPQGLFVNIGCEDFAEAILAVLRAQKGYKLVDYMGAIREKKGRSWSVGRWREEFLSCG
jgi:hypothetical protein